MIRVIVKSENVVAKQGTSKAGKPYSIREQSAALDTGSDFPIPFRLSLDKDQPAYKPGLYTFSPESYHVSDWGDVGLRYPKLVALPASAAKAA